MQEMTLDQWKADMADRFAGCFEIHDLDDGGSLIRHRTLTDCEGHRCCPIVVSAFNESEMDEYVDAANLCAEFVGVGLGLSVANVERIMDAADDRTRPQLREWMERVLCGEVSS